MKCICGSLKFERHTRAVGVWQEEIAYHEDGTINHEECSSSTDGLLYGTPPKTIRCAECGKRYPNPVGVSRGGGPR